MTYDLVRLGDVAEINPRLARSSYLQADTQVRFVPMAAVDEVNGLIADVQHRPFSEVSKGYTNFQTGDVLFAKITPCMQNGKSAIFDDESSPIGFGSTEFYVIRAGNRIFSRFIYHLVRQETFREKAKANFTGTGGQQRVPRDFLENYSLSLPPLDEQQRIVDILDRAASIQRLRQAADEKLKQIIPALFVDMFGDPASNPKGWPTATIGDLIENADYGSSSKAHDEATGLPMLRMGNVTMGGALDLKNIKYVELEPAEQAKFTLKKGDILFNRTNSKELVGKTGIWDGSYDAVYASYFIRLRTKTDKMTPEVLWAFMNSKHTKGLLYGMARGAIGQSNINSKELRAIRLFAPPIALQERFSQLYYDLKAKLAMSAAATASATSIAASLASEVFSAA